ncbi:MAG: hypothetical protein P8101_21375, partial [Candidatus Thiodiazotropha sp.]
RDYPEDSDVNGGFRFKGYTDAGFNYSLNYFHHYSANPDISLSWNDSVSGEELTVQRATSGDFVNNTTGAPGPDGMPDLADLSSNLGVDQVPSDLTAAAPTTILLHNSAGEYYGAYDPTGGMGAYSANPIELRFTESLHRVNSFGASFDYALDTPVAPVVLRGEFLYDQDDKQPVIDKRLLGIGDMTTSLRMEDADYFKYVIGADINVFTNMMVSGQFIQYVNLDYQDDKRTCVTPLAILRNIAGTISSSTKRGVVSGTASIWSTVSLTPSSDPLSGITTGAMKTPPLDSSRSPRMFRWG